MSFEWESDYNSNVISVEDITDRVDELRGERDSAAQDYLDYCEAKGGEAEWDEGEAKWADDNADDARELATLEALLSELCGYGGNHQWEGEWYPDSLINADYFTDYARELADDLYGSEMRAASWPFSHIDWEAAAEALQQDYSTVDLPAPDADAETFYYRG